MNIDYNKNPEFANSLFFLNAYITSEIILIANNLLHICFVICDGVLFFHPILKHKFFLSQFKWKKYALSCRLNSDQRWIGYDLNSKPNTMGSSKIIYNSERLYALTKELKTLEKVRSTFFIIALIFIMYEYRAQIHT